jgi:hypothetical protein
MSTIYFNDQNVLVKSILFLKKFRDQILVTTMEKPKNLVAKASDQFF